MKLRRSALAVVLAAVATSRAASALEGQHHIGIGPSIAMLSIDDKSSLSVGAGVGLHYTYGLNDQFNLMGELSSAVVAANQQQDTPETPHTRPAEVDHVGAGVGYVIDITQWVPYFGALASVYRLSGGTLDKALILPGVELGIGLDYQLSRSWAIGIAGREHLFVTKMSTYPTYTTGLLRLEYMWGY